ncbi:MAG: hypothetical protein WA269_04795 [Candidatus Udaeobacter sp.]
MKVLISSLMIASAVATLVRAQEESASPAEKAKTYPEVPKQYEVGEDTISPDGRFAILYPVRDENSNEGPAFSNVLVRLKPYEVVKELDVDPAWKDMRGSPRAKWGGNQFVAIWREMKWGNEDLVVYELANDKIKREEKKIWPEVVKYFDRDWKNRFLKKYPKEANDRYFFTSDDSEFKNFEFKGDTLLLDIRAENKPNLASGPIWSAELRGVWNLRTGKFDKVDFKPGEISVRKPED